MGAEEVRTAVEGGVGREGEVISAWGGRKGGRGGRQGIVFGDLDIAKCKRTQFFCSLPLFRMGVEYNHLVPRFPNPLPLSAYDLPIFPRLFRTGPSKKQQSARLD